MGYAVRKGTKMKNRLKKVLLKELIIIVAGLSAYAVYVNKDKILEKIQWNH